MTLKRLSFNDHMNQWYENNPDIPRFDILEFLISEEPALPAHLRMRIVYTGKDRLLGGKIINSLRS